MKRATRQIALRAARLHRRLISGQVSPPGATFPEIAKRLKVEPTHAGQILNRGLLIEQLEAHRLTTKEMQVLTVLARLEARRVGLGHGAPSIGDVDHAAGQRSGWCGKIIAPRLRQIRTTDLGVLNIAGRLNFIAYPKDAGAIYLTPTGWAFVWATGLVLKNWKVPA